jgi:acetyl-CoA C-acetyltransferase
MLLWALFSRNFADLIATKYGYSRNDVDGFAVNSQNELHLRKMAFDKSIIPVTDINGWFIWQRMNTSSKYHFRNII